MSYLRTDQKPVLITRAEKDGIGNQADNVLKKLTNSEKKSFILFKDKEGAGQHCQVGARRLFSEKVFSWLDETLS